MSNIDKQTLADDESVKTYYIHPAAFGSTKNPGYGHVAVVRVEDFEKLLAKLEAAEKRAVEMPTFDGYVPHVARELQSAFRIACDNAGINIAAAGKGA